MVLEGSSRTGENSLVHRPTAAAFVYGSRPCRALNETVIVVCSRPPWIEKQTPLAVDFKIVTACMKIPRRESGGSESESGVETGN